MKISGKIQLVVGVMGLSTLLMGAIAVGVVFGYGVKMKEYENASDRSFLGESLNRQVGAVALDSRGIYTANTKRDAKPFAEASGQALRRLTRS